MNTAQMILSVLLVIPWIAFMVLFIALIIKAITQLFNED